MSEMTLSELNVLARRSGESMRCRTVMPHPASARICAANIEWVKRFELVSDDLALKKAADIRCGLCAAYTFPRASEELASIGADLIAWLFLFDDQYGEGCPGDTLAKMRTRFATYLYTVRTRKCRSAATPFHRAIVELCDRARLIANDACSWSERFSDNLGTYFDGALREQPYRSLQRIPRLEEYRQIRALSIGLFPVFELIPLAGAALSASDFEHPTIVRLRTSAALLCAWVNDVYSFAKEERERDPMNLVGVLANEFGLSKRAATAAAAELYNAELDSFEADIATLDGVGPSIRNYIQGLEDWVHGNLAWTGLSGRYI